MAIFRVTTICKFCRRAHRKQTRCKDVNGCYCKTGCTKPGHIRHAHYPQYMMCGDGTCPCVYKVPGPVPTKAVTA